MGKAVLCILVWFARTSHKSKPACDRLPGYFVPGYSRDLHLARRELFLDLHPIRCGRSIFLRPGAHCSGPQKIITGVAGGSTDSVGKVACLGALWSWTPAPPSPTRFGVEWVHPDGQHLVLHVVVHIGSYTSMSSCMMTHAFD